MKYVLLLLFCINVLFAIDCSYNLDNQKITIVTNDIYGCEYDTRSLKEYNNEIQLLFELNSNQDLELKTLIKKQYKIFDIYNYNAPETDKIKDVIYLKNKNILAILHAYHAIIQDKPQEIGVDAIFYKISMYTLSNGFPIKISLDNINMSGIEGFYWGKKKTYKYKNHKKFFDFINSIVISRAIFPTKQPLYKSPNIKTKMYLIKGDKVEILEKKDDWYYILYHGKKDMKAWIPKSAVEESEKQETTSLKPLTKITN